MAVHINETNMLFTLHTRHSTYQMKVEMGRLMHTYYGPRVDETDMSYRFMRADRGFSGNPYESRFLWTPCQWNFRDMDAVITVQTVSR